MTKPAEFPGYRECDKIPGVDVAAYAEIVLDPENPTGIALDSTWGYNRLDLESIVKAGETVTHLELAPTNNPTVLRYHREDGEIDCVTGDELSRITSMRLLKDVAQGTAPSDGVVYMYNGTTNLFEVYDLKTVLGDLNILIGRIQAQITAIDGRLTTVEEKLVPPADAPNDVSLVFGNINHYSDKDYTGSNTLNKNHGLYTHTLATDVLDDLASS